MYLHKYLKTAVTLVCFAPLYLCAGIIYNTAQRQITISDYPASFPCTPELLYTVSRTHGWDVVQHKASSASYTIYADLCIGVNDGTETFFNISASNGVTMTLIVHGNVVVSPYFVPGGAPSDWRQVVPRVNRLTIGMPGDVKAGGALKINSDPENQRSLYIGALPVADGGAMRGGQGGELRVYGGIITALTQTWDNAMGAPGTDRMVYFFGDVELHNATLSWMAGFMGYGRNITAINTVYEHGAAAVVNAQARYACFSGCTFRHLKTAVLDWGGLHAVLRDCVFAENDVNWRLTHGRGLECIDCEIGAPRKHDVYRAYMNPATGKTNYPRVVSMRHVTVRVVDGDGRPISGAVVEARAADGVMLPVTSQTGKDGCTPGQNTPVRRGVAPLLLAEFKRQASDTPDQPVVTGYAWNIHVTAPGFAENIVENYQPHRSWDVVQVTL